MFRAGRTLVRQTGRTAERQLFEKREVDMGKDGVDGLLDGKTKKQKANRQKSKRQKVKKQKI